MLVKISFNDISSIPSLSDDPFTSSCSIEHHFQDTPRFRSGPFLNIALKHVILVLEISVNTYIIIHGFLFVENSRVVAEEVFHVSLLACSIFWVLSPWWQGHFLNEHAPLGGNLLAELIPFIGTVRADNFSFWYQDSGVCVFSLVELLRCCIAWVAFRTMSCIRMELVPIWIVVVIGVVFSEYLNFCKVKCSILFDRNHLDMSANNAFTTLYFMPRLCSFVGFDFLAKNTINLNSDSFTFLASSILDSDCVYPVFVILTESSRPVFTSSLRELEVSCFIPINSSFCSLSKATFWSLSTRQAYNMPIHCTSINLDLSNTQLLIGILRSTNPNSCSNNRSNTLNINPPISIFFQQCLRSVSTVVLLSSYCCSICRSAFFVVDVYFRIGQVFFTAVLSVLNSNFLDVVTAILKFSCPIFCRFLLS